MAMKNGALNSMLMTALVFGALLAMLPTPSSAQRSVTNLRSNQIRTRHLIDGSVTSGKLAIKAVTVLVNAAATTGSSAADPTLAGGFLVACTPNANQDQLLDNAVLNADGSITLTLAAAATAQNSFSCKAIKANAQGVT
jgi:hypothetical protein